MAITNAPSKTKAPHQRSNTSKVTFIRVVVHARTSNKRRVSRIYGLTPAPGASVWLRRIPNRRPDG